MASCQIHIIESTGCHLIYLQEAESIFDELFVLLLSEDEEPPEPA